jgi:hypothetical protein
MTSYGQEIFSHHNCILYDYQRDGKMIRTGIGFYKITDTRERNAEICDEWHIENWDILVEVLDSPWVAEFQPKFTGSKNHWTARHFKLYTHDICFEFLASEWYLIPEYEGCWADVFPDYNFFRMPEEMYKTYLQKRKESV